MESILRNLTNRAIRTKFTGDVFSMCVNVLLYGSKTWPLKTEDVKQLVIVDSGMVRWICGVSLKDCILMTNLLLRLGLNSINMLRWNLLRFHRHLIHIYEAWPKAATMHYIDGRQPRGHHVRGFVTQSVWI